MKAVIVKVGKKEAVQRFRDHKVAKIFYRMCKEHFGDTAKVYLVGRSGDTVRMPPEGYHPIPPKYWCPYCRHERRFKVDKAHSRNARFCSVCGVSTHDFYFKKANRVWETVSRSKKGRRKK